MARRIISAVTDLSLAASRFLIVTRLSLKRPFLVFAQMYVNPRKSNVDAMRFWAHLRERFAQFVLEVDPGKTRLIEFGASLAQPAEARRSQA